MTIRAEEEAQARRMKAEEQEREEEEYKCWQYEVANGNTILGLDKWKEYRA